MLIKNKKTKKAYLIVSLVQTDGGVVREVSVENEEEEDFFGAQEIHYQSLVREREIKYFKDSHFTFSIEKIKELMQVKTKEEFVNKYFYQFENADDELAYSRFYRKQ